jgi:hypothetical protein
VSKKKRLMLLEKTTSFGVKSFMNSQFLKLRPTLQLIVQQVPLLLRSTFWRKKFLNLENNPKVQRMSQRRYSLLTIRFKAGALELFKSWTNSLMKILARTPTNQWLSNLKRLCRLSAVS